MKGLLRTTTLIVLATVWFAPAAQEQEATERELEQLRASIAELERDVERQRARRDDGAAELAGIELSLAASRQSLADFDQSIADQTERLAEIAAEQDEARGRLSGEQDALASQVRMSYMTGRQELIRLLLSQDNPADFGRMLVYYDYLNRHRSEQISVVDAELLQLARLIAENEAVSAELAQLRAEQEAQAIQLEQEQLERRELLAALDASIEASGSRIEQMRAEEAELNQIIARLSEMLEDFPVNSNAPFVDQRGVLPPPVRGELAARFGEPRDPRGEVSWTGLLFEAETGTPVQAVYHGVVAFAGWQGHVGFVMILDHGDGYMSLYGHNSALLRERGDWVRAGDVIARVGDSGGQPASALLFSILREGEARDPEDWLR